MACTSEAGGPLESGPKPPASHWLYTRGIGDCDMAHTWSLSVFCKKPVGSSRLLCAQPLRSMSSAEMDREAPHPTHPQRECGEGCRRGCPHPTPTPAEGRGPRAEGHSSLPGSLLGSVTATAAGFKVVISMAGSVPCAQQVTFHMSTLRIRPALLPPEQNLQGLSLRGQHTGPSMQCVSELSRAIYLFKKGFPSHITPVESYALAFSLCT